MNRNTNPATVWDALRRLLLCNKQQLADRLGVDRRTLHRWENCEAGADAMRRASALLIATLRNADHSDALAQWTINFEAIHTAGGRR